MRDFLQVAARGGSGSAARTLGSGLAGLTTRTKRLGLGLGALLFIAYLGWDMLGGVAAGPAARETGPVEPLPVASTPVPESTTQAIPESGARRVAYSVDLSEIAGLSPAADPGTTVELWVTWERPLTRYPKLQPLVSDALLAEVSSPVTPDGPTVATFLVTRGKVEDLLLADRYGLLSATVASP